MEAALTDYEKSCGQCEALENEEANLQSELKKLKSQVQSVAASMRMLDAAKASLIPGYVEKAASFASSLHPAVKIAVNMLTSANTKAKSQLDAQEKVIALLLDLISRV